jgi:SAM-dependent methyltransferase
MPSSPSNAHAKRSRLRRHLLSFLQVEALNYIVFRLRFFYFIHLKRNLKIYGNENSVRAHKYSIDMLKAGKTSNRPLQLIRPLSVIQATRKEGSVLSIGSRFETELLFLMGYGFNPHKIRGLDMISYSPLIDVGNMHALPFQENSYDTVILGWVLPYSDQPELAAREVLRVIKPGGMVAIGHTHYPKHRWQEIVASQKFAVDPALRKQTTREILDLFGAAIDRVYYTHDPATPELEGTCSVIFSVK